MDRERGRSLHFDQIPIFKSVVRVALQWGEVANTIIDGDAGGKGNTLKKRRKPKNFLSRKTMVSYLFETTPL